MEEGDERGEGGSLGREIGSSSKRSGSFFSALRSPEYSVSYLQGNEWKELD